MNIFVKKQLRMDEKEGKEIRMHANKCLKEPLLNIHLACRGVDIEILTGIPSASALLLRSRASISCEFHPTRERYNWCNLMELRRWKCFQEASSSILYFLRDNMMKSLSLREVVRAATKSRWGLFCHQHPHTLQTRENSSWVKEKLSFFRTIKPTQNGSIHLFPSLSSGHPPPRSPIHSKKFSFKTKVKFPSFQAEHCAK